MFSVALPIALAALSPAAPATSIISNAAIAVYFSPEEDCGAFAVRAIDNAEAEILVGAYRLTTGSGIAMRTRKRDRAASCREGAGLDR